jgi:cell fate regulator YaaT (PSP1 superfamily)
MDETMVKVTGVKFKKNGKMYYFDPGELQLQQGDGVIVETARGMEFARVTMGSAEIQESDITHPLKKVVRIADEADIQRHEENEGKKGHAMEVCREKIQKHHLDMKLIDVEFTFDNNKIIFYFTADGRVDFRDLVKDLASIFKMRIELRQVGVRDEAKMLGGIGCCGRELCCASWLSDFQPVSIKMTKTQNLSLNPTKISGVCGRLMCCLKYENSTYQELRKGMPEVNERVRVGDEIGKVIETNILRGTVKVRMFTGEKDDNGREKMNSEILTFEKDELERLGKKGNAGKPGSTDQNPPMKCPCQGKCHRMAEGAEASDEAGTQEKTKTDAQEAASAENALEKPSKEEHEHRRKHGSSSEKNRDSRDFRRNREKNKERGGESGSGKGNGKRKSRQNSGKKRNSQNGGNKKKEHKKTEVVFQSFSFDEKEGKQKPENGLKHGEHSRIESRNGGNGRNSETETAGASSEKGTSSDSGAQS